MGIWDTACPQGFDQLWAAPLKSLGLGRETGSRKTKERVVPRDEEVRVALRAKGSWKIPETFELWILTRSSLGFFQPGRR